MDESALDDHDFNRLREIVHQVVGISLSENKKMLIVSRLSKRLRVLKLEDFGQYIAYLEDPRNTDQEVVELTNCITTNKTDFFREPHHFAFIFESWLPAILANKPQDLRIWSAGCSSGKEPYTIAMVVKRYLDIHPKQTPPGGIKILATDIDTTVLEKAQLAEYPLSDLADIPEIFHLSCINKGSDSFGIKPHLREMIRFGRFNLTHPFPFKHGFDLIFCRNVLIYFDRFDRGQIVSAFDHVLKPGAFLLLGHSESLVADDHGFTNLGNTVYKKER